VINQWGGDMIVLGKFRGALALILNSKSLDRPAMLRRASNKPAVEQYQILCAARFVITVE
jgi:hypothetical protein